MAVPANFTNFGGLTPLQKKVWSRDLWKQARNASFVMRFAARGPNAVIQRVTELTKTERGDRAVIPLVTDLSGDGVVGDYELWNHEEAISAQSIEITFDQIRNANRKRGRMSEQRTVIRFRETSRDVLAYWMASTIDQMAFLTLSGLPWFLSLDGKLRSTWQFNAATGNIERNPAFPQPNPGDPGGYSLADHASAAANVDGTVNTGPTGLPEQPPLEASRHYVVDSATLDANGRPTLRSGVSPVAVDLAELKYHHLVELKAIAKSNYVRGVRGPNGREYYYLLVHPLTLAQLKQDPQFLSAVSQAGARGNQNPFFSGAIETIDGLVIVEHRLVFNTSQAAGVANGVALPVNTGNAFANGYGTGWGTARTQRASRSLLLGAQALAMADLGDPTWDEQTWDYNNQQGIAVSKMIGFVRPKFTNPYVGNTLQDFGVLAVDSAV